MIKRIISFVIQVVAGAGSFFAGKHIIDTFTPDSPRIIIFLAISAIAAGLFLWARVGEDLLILWKILKGRGKTK